MRSWYKYIVEDNSATINSDKDKATSEHKKSMGGYLTTKGYSNKEDFFNTYFENGPERHKLYHKFLMENVSKEQLGLSIGSGRCVNELMLIEEGYKITCSDLEQYCKEDTLKIFPQIEFEEFDISKAAFKRQVNYAFSLSVFYLFGENDLRQVFRNVKASLAEGGKFIVDVGGAEDNVWTYILDECVCQLDARLKYFVKKYIRKEDVCFYRKQHGFRHKNKDVIRIAQEVGFSFIKCKQADRVSEFKGRLALFYRLPNICSAILGIGLPYVRIFQFELKESKKNYDNTIQNIPEASKL